MSIVVCYKCTAYREEGRDGEREGERDRKRERGKVRGEGEREREREIAVHGEETDVECAL